MLPGRYSIASGSDWPQRWTEGRPLLKNITLDVCAGEIVGIAGVDDNGQKELSEIISGLRKPGSGRISLFGKNVTTATTRQLIEMGMSYIPADRRNQGLVIDFTIAENMILETYYNKPFTKGFSLDKKYISQFASNLVQEYDVRTPSIDVPGQEPFRREPAKSNRQS